MWSMWCAFPDFVLTGLAIHDIFEKESCVSGWKAGLFSGDAKREGQYDF